jgi:hypothetical protein
MGLLVLTLENQFVFLDIYAFMRKKLVVIQLRDSPESVAWVIARAARCASIVQTGKVGEVSVEPIVHSAGDGGPQVLILDILVSTWEATVPGG